MAAAECASKCMVGEEAPEVTGRVLEALFNDEKRDGRSLAAAVKLADELRKSDTELGRTAVRLLTGFERESRQNNLDRDFEMVPVNGEFLMDQYPVTNKKFERMISGHDRCE